ncbi:hypothetical protein BB561_001674 [Smittium simulii]|uniref:Reverse transcriptase domain-containing protein n=1 Tax=Smittium simulii TaxID=133385 RepID=A0A2T9YTH9_9FUNG|nr:hypothetical protein BB561_001674 [Smittium simulii]
MHLLNDSKPKSLKKACYSGSNTKIGCSWTQFSGNINAAIDYVAFKIDDEYISYQHDSRAKATYFMFYNEEGAEKCMNTPIYYNGIAVELYQTVTLKEGTQIITIPSTNSIIIRMVVEVVNNAFTKNKIIYDFSAYKNKSSGKFHTFGIKLLFKKTIDSFEIPVFFEFDKFVLALTYRGCKPVCNFCKKLGHWKSECTEIQKFKQNKLKNTKKNSKSGQNTVGLAPKSAMETKLNTMFADINKKISQEAIIKDEKQDGNTVKNKTTSQVINVKDSTKPKKLQSLELDTKKEELISKKNIDRLTESNSTKQLDKIELELSDQPIYANSSCPKSNFKVMTFNVQSIYNEVEELELIINKTNPATDSGLLIAAQNRSSFGAYTNLEMNIHRCDFNMDTKSTINWINKMGVELTRMSVFNSKGSRLKGNKMSRMIDHICTCNFSHQFIEASVIKNVDISDHFPIAGIWIKNKNIIDLDQAKKIDMNKLQLEANNIVNHNYYAVLAVPGAETGEKKQGKRREKYCEYNITPTWNNITTALKTTPNNKAAVRDETEPKSHLAILINKLINKAWNECNLIGTNNTSVVVPIFKNGNRQDPNNYRDFEKAYNRVPHNQLSHKLEYIKVNDTVSNPVDYKRVSVPGFKDKEPGLLFDDDAVILAGSADELQKSFDTLTEWCKRWDMNVNNKKCGIMAIKFLTDTTFKIQNQLIPYIGCYSILKRNDVLTKFKVMVIKAIIQAVATYGGKLFEMSATRCKQLQQVVDAATQTLAKCGKTAVMVRLRQELSLTDLNIKTAVARTRAFGKWASLRTWISDLIKYPYKHRCDTWVSGCARWPKKYNGNINKIKNTIETLNNRQKKNDKSQISKWIADTEAGTSCNCMGLELVYPELKTHINYVFKIRNGTYWTARRYAKSGFIEKRFIEECPFCRNIAPETIEHMLLECSRWQALRADILAQYINIYRAQVATKPPLLSVSISMRLVGKLLGDELKLSSTRIHKDPMYSALKLRWQQQSF